MTPPQRPRPAREHVDLDDVEIIAVRRAPSKGLDRRGTPRRKAAELPARRHTAASSNRTEVIEISDDDIEEIVVLESGRGSMKRKACIGDVANGKGKGREESVVSTVVTQQHMPAKKPKINMRTPLAHLKAMRSTAVPAEGCASTSSRTLDCNVKDEILDIEMDVDASFSSRAFAWPQAARVEVVPDSDTDSDSDSDCSIGLGIEDNNDMVINAEEEKKLVLRMGMHVDNVDAQEPLPGTPHRPKLNSGVLDNPHTKGPPKQGTDRYRRIWDAPHETQYKPLQTDFSRRIVRRDILRSTGQLSNSTFNTILNARPLRLVSPQHRTKTSGSITKITQSGKHLAIASAAIGGDADPAGVNASGHPTIDPYNTDGNLLYWSGKRFVDMEEHSRKWVVNSDTQSGVTKYYTVNYVDFDPVVPGRMVSSGNDCVVNVWDFPNDTEEFERFRPKQLRYTDIPHDIHFKPGSSVFAVSCADGDIHVHSGDSDERLGVCQDTESTTPGCFMWGGTSENQQLSNYLFASSETRNTGEDDICCEHLAFDVATGKQMYRFDNEEQGDAMALNPKGDALAIVTNPGGGRNALYLYDVARSNGRRPTHSAKLSLPAKRSSSSLSPSDDDAYEVNSATFSPDGTFLALARTDNVVLVYDARFLGGRRDDDDGSSGSGPRVWACLRHPWRPAHSHARGGFGYGITGLQWVEGLGPGGGLGLVTSGADGCVRLWDIMRPPAHEKESMILVEADHDIACFSIGDQTKGERRLVVGDCGGGVYVYD